nr:leucine-rich repeat-containing protein [Tanacetum cinerariifolium]
MWHATRVLTRHENLGFLDLARNNIHGLIPDWAGEVGGNKLVYLDLSDNSITGLSLFQWSGLEHLYLQSNMIRGQFPLSICDMNNLKYLDMSNNSFYGVIPQCFVTITSSLLMINLGQNYFSGTIPNMNENCTLSEGLILNNNQLKGDVPRSLLKCRDLKVLDLGNNHLKGIFPRWLEGVTKLEVLVLRSNNLHGRLPGEYFENFNAIRDVDKNPNGNHVNINVSSYSIIVPVNSEAHWPGSQVFVKFSLIDLSSNKFEGEIPNVIGSLKSLAVLNLSHNNLSGQIPNELGNLIAVEALDLSWNQLSEEIPQCLVENHNLLVLNLSQNHLEGRIPQGEQFDTFDESSFGGNPGLCGFPLYKRCEGMVPAQVDDDEDDIDCIFPWKVMVLGYGCRTLLGLLMGYRMLSTRKPKWFNAIYDAVERMIPIRQKKRKHVNAKKRNQRSNGTYVLSSRRSLYRNNFGV